MDYLDYSEVKFSFVGVRKHFFQDKHYYISVFDDCFMMGTSANTQHPKYIIKYGFHTKIQWNLKKFKQGLQIESFCFPYNNRMKAVQANNDDLLKFKEFISLKVTFDGIQDLFSPLFQIGKGSSAKVYSATNLLDHQIYAIKAIEKQFLQQQHESGQAAFKMEVSVLKKLATHPENFLTLKEIYEGETTHYLVTSYLEGLSLTQELDLLKLKDQQRFPLETVKLIMWKLLKNLDILHSHKIIHRDLKPDNLMFSRKDDYSSLVLVDFGLAISESMEKFLFPKCGTPGFVAPEILQMKTQSKYTTKVDIFSCGCIFYRLITGSNIFGGITFEEALKQNRQCQINFNLQQDQIYVTDQSINLLQLMLIKNPKQRINAKIALQHSFFDQLNDQFHIYPLNSSKRSTKVNLNMKLEDQFSESSDDDEINNEKSLQESQQISLPKSKKCSLMGDFSLLSQSPTKNFLDLQQFYQKDPLFGLRCIKVSQSPCASQILE